MFIRGREDKLKEKKIDLLEVNTVVSEMKNTVGGMNSRLDVAEEKINKCDDVVIETT